MPANKLKKISSLIFLVCLFSILATSPVFADDYLLPGVDKDSGIEDYIRAIYVFAIGLVGIIATVVIMIGGLIWISSLGNANRVNDAKEWIGAALYGLALAMFSYMILFLINPDLVTFQPLNPKTVGAIDNAKEQKQEPVVASQMGYCVRGGEGGTECSESVEKDCTASGGHWEASFPTTCRGKIEQKTGSSFDAKNNCRPDLLAAGKCSDCINCVAIDGIRYNDGNKMDAAIAEKVKNALTDPNNKIKGERLSEAWPPDYGHKSVCHANGSCVDISMDSRDPTEVQKMYDKLVANGLSPMYEPPVLECNPQPRCNCARYKGVNCNPNTKNTGAHFHVTNQK